jgi:glycine/D-amino acid oxidase-like deaminating enzyme
VSEGAPDSVATGKRVAAQTKTDVVVIGGGITGCATAYRLAQAGLDVILLERGELNREASGTNAGNIHVQLLSHLERRPASRRAMEALHASVVLHREAGEIWRNLEAELREDLGLRLRGGLMVGETTEELRSLEQKARLERELGLETHVITGDEARAMCPALSARISGAGYCEAEGFVNPLQVAPAFARAATEAGATIRVDTAVVGLNAERPGRFSVETSGGRIHARWVVNAAGATAAPIARMVGLELPVSGSLLQVHVTEPWPPTIDHMIQHIGQRLTLKQTQYGTFIIGGGWPGGDSSTRTPILETILGNLSLAARVMPELGRIRVLRSWCGLIPTTNGRVTIIDEYRRAPGFYVAVSGETGLTLGPLVGRTVTELVQGKKPSVPVEAFGLEGVPAPPKLGVPMKSTLQ